ncbi:MAG: site-specific integrase [Candidatus Marinimicrobia bacterium]|nr:site-specific integrase [Candidatus Neomarinimicrobiota bacterium]
MASLQKHRGKYYAHVSYKEDGKYKQKVIPLYLKQKKRAESRLLEIQRQEKLFKEGRIKLSDISVEKPPEEIKEKNHNYKRSWTLVINRFLKYKKRHVSKKTVQVYEVALRRLKNIFADKKYKDITRQDRDRFEEGLTEIYPNKTSYNIYLRSIRAFFNWLKDEGKIKELPFKFKQKATKPNRPKYFTQEQIDMILEEASKQSKELYARIYFHFNTGCRLSEIHKAIYHNGFIKITDPIKNGAERSIPIDDKTREQFFIAKEGQYTDNTIGRKFRKILRKLDLYKINGETYSFHNTRHTYAVKKYAETKDIYKVKTLLGHKSVTTTEIYATFNIDELRNDFNITDNNRKNQKGKPLTNQRKGQRDRTSRENNQKSMDYFQLNQQVVYNA